MRNAFIKRSSSIRSILPLSSANTSPKSRPYIFLVHLQRGSSRTDELSLKIDPVWDPITVVCHFSAGDHLQLEFEQIHDLPTVPTKGEGHVAELRVDVLRSDGLTEIVVEALVAPAFGFYELLCLFERPAHGEHAP